MSSIKNWVLLFVVAGLQEQWAVPCVGWDGGLRRY